MRSHYVLATPTAIQKASRGRTRAPPPRSSKAAQPCLIQPAPFQVVHRHAPSRHHIGDGSAGVSDQAHTPVYQLADHLRGLAARAIEARVEDSAPVQELLSMAKLWSPLVAG
jgi:hypothetical protein